MSLLVVDSGGVGRLAERSPRALAMLRSLRAAGLWPPVVPTVVLVESLRGDSRRDANTNRLLKTCILEPQVSLSVARRAAELRRLAGTGSLVDAVVVALAEPGGVVLTGDPEDLGALAAHASDVVVEPV